jgi:hypothetical protein
VEYIFFIEGLLELNFDFNYNTPSLNQWTVHVLQLSGIWEPPSAPAATMATRTTGTYIAVLFILPFPNP